MVAAPIVAVVDPDCFAVFPVVAVEVAGVDSIIPKVNGGNV